MSAPFQTVIIGRQTVDLSLCFGAVYYGLLGLCFLVLMALFYIRQFNFHADEYHVLWIYTCVPTLMAFMLMSAVSCWDIFGQYAAANVDVESEALQPNGQPMKPRMCALPKLVWTVPLLVSQVCVTLRLDQIDFLQSIPWSALLAPGYLALFMYLWDRDRMNHTSALDAPLSVLELLLMLGCAIAAGLALDEAIDTSIMKIYLGLCVGLTLRPLLHSFSLCFSDVQQAYHRRSLCFLDQLFLYYMVKNVGRMGLVGGFVVALQERAFFMEDPYRILGLLVLHCVFIAADILGCYAPIWVASVRINWSAHEDDAGQFPPQYNCPPPAYPAK